MASASSSVGGLSSDWDTPIKRRREKIAGVDQDELLDPSELADPDSCFCEFEGVRIHHKVYQPEPQQNQSEDSGFQTQRVGLPMILLHGFGASLFSWQRAMKHLAAVCGSKVLAFDRPAFGLTSRTSSRDDARPLNPYSMAFAVLVTLYFIDILAAEKAILVGHSAGSLVAVSSYFKEPERVAALILVAPAILAPGVVTKPESENDEIQKEGTTSQILNPVISLSKILLNLFKYVTRAVIHLVRGMTDMLSSLSKKVLSAVLGSTIGLVLIRTVIDKFGRAAVRNAWYDSSLVTDHILDGYTKPLRTKNWDRALVEFVRAMLTASGPEINLPVEKRLHEISCPVLIITGDSDRIVPAWNAERVHRAIPGSHLKVMNKCGHLPQEERPDEFVSIVEEFLQKAFEERKELGHRPATAALL